MKLKKRQSTFKILVLVCIIAFFAKCTCEPTYEMQFDDCYSSYTVELEECHGNENCETTAIDVFQECIGYKYIYPVHFVVLTDELQGTDDEVNSELRAVVDTLNRYFTVEDNSLPPDNRKRIITFTFKSSTLFAEATGIGGDLVDHASPDFIFEDRHDFRPFVNGELNPALMDDNAINIYIVDSKSRDSLGVVTDVSSSHAKNNDDHPYCVIDYARINGDRNRVGVEEHEMGHGFGLAHVCTPGASGSSNTNIMSSSGKYPTSNIFEYISGDSESICDTGSSGKRNIGFNVQQCQIILRNSEEIKIELGL